MYSFISTLLIKATVYIRMHFLQLFILEVSGTEKSICPFVMETP